jgi:hypothetical protein
MLDIQSIREKLRKLKCKNLCEMVMKQRKSKCLLNGYCPLHFRYEGFTFCVSEVLPSVPLWKAFAKAIPIIWWQQHL